MAQKKVARVNPVLIFLLATFYRFYFFFLRIKIVYSDEYLKELAAGRQPLVSYWHQDVNSLIYMATKFKLLSMSSESRDGQIVVQLIESFGSTAARGSARKNPVKGLISFIRLFSTGKYIGTIAVDGPKGPAKKVKIGILEVARKTKAQIFTASVAYSNPWILKKTWDQTVFPKPFSRVIFYLGPSDLNIPEKRPESYTELSTSLEKAMSRNQEKALSLL